jgi:hypothetical protein
LFLPPLPTPEELPLAPQQPFQLHQAHHLLSHITNIVLSAITKMPDLNSVPASPHPTAGSRRQSSSQATLPPHLQTNPRRLSSTQTSTADASIHILPSNQSTVNQSRRTSEASQPSPFIPTPGSDRDRDASIVAGPGPIRHPRALTAAELHIQLEKEQEAVVSPPSPHSAVDLNC